MSVSPFSCAIRRETTINFALWIGFLVRQSATKPHGPLYANACFRNNVQKSAFVIPDRRAMVFFEMNQSPQRIDRRWKWCNSRSRQERKRHCAGEKHTRFAIFHSTPIVTSWQRSLYSQRQKAKELQEKHTYSSKWFPSDAALTPCQVIHAPKSPLCAPGVKHLAHNWRYEASVAVNISPCSASH